MNIGFTSLNKMLPNQIQWYVKTVTHYDWTGFISGAQGKFRIEKAITTIHTKWIRKKNYTIKLINIEKEFDKIKHSLMNDKQFPQTWNKRNLIKSIY